MQIEMNTSAAPAVKVRVQLRNVAPASRVQSREDVVRNVVNYLVNKGFSHAEAPNVAEQAYDGYVQKFWHVPANANYVTTVLATPQGRDWLEGKLAEVLAKRPKAVMLPAVQEVQQVPMMKPAAKPVEAKVPAAVIPQLPRKVQKRLTALVRKARVDHLVSGATPRERDDSIIDAAVTTVVETCGKYGVREFVMPYRNRYKAAGLFIGRLLALKLGPFFLIWAEDGLEDEAEPETTPKKAPKPVQVAVQPIIWRNGVQMMRDAEGKLVPKGA